MIGLLTGVAVAVPTIISSRLIVSSIFAFDMLIIELRAGEFVCQDTKKLQTSCPGKLMLRTDVCGKFRDSGAPELVAVVFVGSREELEEDTVALFARSSVWKSNCDRIQVQRSVRSGLSTHSSIFSVSGAFSRGLKAGGLPPAACTCHVLLWMGQMLILPMRSKFFVTVNRHE